MIKQHPYSTGKRQVNLKNADLRDIDLTRANADLRQADLTRASLFQRE